MRPSVQTFFRQFSVGFVGCVPYMYLDVLGLVTVGVGNLIDPVDSALKLPFKFKDKPGIATPGALASQTQIAAEWQNVKNNHSLAQKGSVAASLVTDLMLDSAAIDATIADRLGKNETFLKTQPNFHNFDAWPADAQLALLSMAWAMGPGGFAGFPNFSAACRRLDFASAAAECKMNDQGNAGLVPRNTANKTMFSNASKVQANPPGSNLDPSVLYYPRIL